MIEADLSRKKRAEKIDAAAAAFILQGALDRIARDPRQRRRELSELEIADVEAAEIRPHRRHPIPPASARVARKICVRMLHALRRRRIGRQPVRQHVAEQHAAGHAHRGLRRAGKEAAAATPGALSHGPAASAAATTGAVPAALELFDPRLRVVQRLLLHHDRLRHVVRRGRLLPRSWR